MEHDNIEDSWEAFRQRFADYRCKPTWNHWSHPPDSRGVLAPRDVELMGRKGQRATKRLEEAIARLKLDTLFPARPSQFAQADMARIIGERLLPKRLLDTFWRALVFNRSNYSCFYCRRSVASVWEESGQQRTISLTCDHCEPKARGGEDYSLTNARAACWLCNGIKSTLPETVFRLELQSLVHAFSLDREMAPEGSRIVT